MVSDFVIKRSPVASFPLVTRQLQPTDPGPVVSPKSQMLKTPAAMTVSHPEMTTNLIDDKEIQFYLDYFICKIT